MWHSSVEYWVCYCMFRSKRTKAFPRVAWPSLFKDGDVTNWYQSMRDFSGVAFPGLWVAEGRYKLVSERCAIPKLCTVDIGAQRKSSVRKFSVRQRRNA
jgi:hypothetical protein